MEFEKKLEGTIFGTYQLIFAIYFVKLVPNITCVLLWEFLPKDTMSNVIHQEMKVKLPLFYKKKPTCKKIGCQNLTKISFAASLAGVLFVLQLQKLNFVKRLKSRGLTASLARLNSVMKCSTFWCTHFSATRCLAWRWWCRMDIMIASSLGWSGLVPWPTMPLDVAVTRWMSFHFGVLSVPASLYHCWLWRRYKFTMQCLCLSFSFSQCCHWNGN